MPVRRYSFLMPAEDHHFYRWMVARYRARTTQQGRGLLLGAALALLLARGISAAAVVGVVALGALLAGWSVGLFFRPRVRVARELPAAPSTGELLRYRVRVKNLGKRPIRGLTVLESALPFGLYMVPEAAGGTASSSRLAPGEEVVLSLALRCGDRGAYELQPLAVASTFPSGLVRLPRRAGSRQRFLVYPRFTTQHEFELPVGRRYQPGGIAVSSKVGDSTEFLGTRDYREGDRLRDIHWSSYARSGRLIVKEYLEEYFVRVGLVLDTQTARRESPAALEARISLAAGIADALARRDHVIDLFAAGETLHRLQAGRALARLDNVLELLACVEPAARVDFAAVEQSLMREAQQLSSIVMLLADWDKERARVCRRLREAGTGVRPILVRNRPPSLEPEPDVVLTSAAVAEELIR